ncbi:hypothetical protein OPT61_g4149 [Boeremia exigua]|uniref:Uncharacterized protein n=1 Tax=Boeremia exigua TaxID=749465 RepID=A0ACC2IF73_9PLEO|nr:hypothetical protein OPT61_g4149 [Boeremia exigua]
MGTGSPASASSGVVSDGPAAADRTGDDIVEAAAVTSTGSQLAKPASATRAKEHQPHRIHYPHRVSPPAPLASPPHAPLSAISKQPTCAPPHPRDEDPPPHSNSPVRHAAARRGRAVRRLRPHLHFAAGASRYGAGSRCDDRLVAERVRRRGRTGVSRAGGRGCGAD